MGSDSSVLPGACLGSGSTLSISRNRLLQLPGNTGPSDSTSFWLATHIRQTPGAQAQLQSAADDGTTAARQMGTISEPAFMKARPDIAQRYDHDPAFKAGFDAYTWAEQYSPRDVKTMSRQLDSKAAALTTDSKSADAELSKLQATMASVQRA